MLSDRRILSLGATSMGHLGRTQKSQAASEKKLKAYACELEQKLEARTRELSEAREQQTATAEVLNVISSSPGNLQPVFDTIAANALNLCGAAFSVVVRFDGELMELAAMHNLSDLQGIDALRRVFPRPPRAGGATDRAILTRNIAYIPDVREDREYQHQSLAQATSYRSILSVPILRQGKPVGAITVAGASPGAFSERQADLLTTFAAQASSRSRTHGCSTSCGNRCSSRPQRPKSSRSSVHRPVSWSSSSRPCWRMHFASARLSSACCTVIATASSSRRPWSVRRPPLWTLCCANRLRRRPAFPSIGCCGQNKWSTPWTRPRKRTNLFRPD